MLNEYFCKSPDNEFFYIEKLGYDIWFKRDIVDYDLVPDNLKNNFKIKTLYLSSYIATNKISRFFSTFSNILSNEEQNKILSKKLYLDASLNELTDKVFQDKIIIFADDTNRITQALGYFEPREINLWRIEYKAFLLSLIESIVNSYLALANYEEAYTIFKETKNHQIILNEYLKVKYIEVLVHCAPELVSDEIEYNLTSFSSQSLVFLANLSLFLNKGEILQSIFSRVEEIGLASERDYCQAILWTYKKKNNLLDLQEIERSTVISTEDITFLCLTGDLLFNFNEQLFKKINDRLFQIVTKDSPLLDRQRFAYFLTNTNQYKEAIPFLERLTLNNDAYSFYHEFLILCNLKEGRNKKAKELIDIFLEKYKENEAIRVYATNLAMSTRDWEFLEHLTKMEETINPTHATTWLMKIEAYNKLRNKNQIKQLIKSIPESLDGSPELIGKVALQEINNNFLDKGFERLYKILRLHFQNPQIREMFAIAVLAEALGIVSLKNFLSNPNKVQMGSKVICSNSFSGKYEIYFDIVDGLPERELFCSPSSALFVQIENKTIKDTFEFNNHTWTIDKIENIYVAVNSIIYNSNPLTTGELPNIKAIKLDPNDQESVKKWMESMVAPIKKRREHIKHVLKIYSGNSYITLGFLSRHIGVKPYKLLHEWPMESNTPLVISENPIIEENIATEIISDLENGAPVVIDSLSFFEIAQYNMLDTLSFIPNIVITAITYETIKVWMDDVSCRLKQNTKGFLNITDNGEPILINNEASEYSFIELKQKLEKIICFIENSCDTQPVYGPIGSDQSLLEAREVLSEEEYMFLQLCTEKSAILFSIDARLRSIANCFGVRTLSPNIYAGQLMRNNSISISNYYDSQILQFINNRKLSPSIPTAQICKFTAKTINNLKQILFRLKEDCKVSKNISLFIKLFFSLLYHYITQKIYIFTYGALAKIISYVLSGVFLNPHCNQEAIIELVINRIKCLFLENADFLIKLVDFEEIKGNELVSLDQLNILYGYNIPIVKLT